MATSKVNHNSGFITISIVILLAGVAIFSGQFIPDYFGGNVIGGPGGGGGIGGGGGTTLPIIADTLNPIYLSVSSIGQTSVSLAFQLPCNIGDNTQQNQQCEENAISNYQIRYGTQGEITDDNVFNTLPGPVYCLVGSNCLALDENTVIERTISGLQPNTQYWFVAQYTHKTKGDSPWSNSPPGKTLTNDADGDGIINTNDVCPNTPAGQQVDSTGCADSQIDIDSDTYTRDVDCNDNNANVNPQAPEICGDAIDQDCTGADLACAPTDNDGDGIINANDLCPNTPAEETANSNGCSDSQIDGDSDTYTLDLDCNDNDATINSGATDVCGDSVDQDCSGEDAICVLDDDNDGVINANDICSGTLANEEVDANGCATTQIDDDADTYTEVAGDCNDNSAEAHPGGTEVCSDALDNDCNGYVDLDDTTCQIITGDSDAGSGTTSDSGAGGGGGQQSSGGGQQSSQQGSSIPFFPSKKKVSSESSGEAQKESALGTTIEGTETKDGQGLDFLGISVAAILGSALAVFGYLRYFKPELFKKLFGGSKNSKSNNTTDLFKISNLFKGKSS